jgi:hypothetical protein
LHLIINKKINMFKLAGQVKVINATQQVSEKFSKREFVLTDSSSMYPQDISFQLTQDKCSLLDGVNVNDQIEVSFSIQGREWTSPAGEVKYFNSLNAFRIERQAAANATTGIPAMQAAPAIPTQNLEAAADDDLPF